MAKFPEASARLFKNVFVCKKCKTKIKAIPKKIQEKRIKCRRCGCKTLRAIRKVKAAASK